MNHTFRLFFQLVLMASMTLHINLSASDAMQELIASEESDRELLKSRNMQLLLDHGINCGELQVVEHALQGGADANLRRRDLLVLERRDAIKFGSSGNDTMLEFALGVLKEALDTELSFKSDSDKKYYFNPALQSKDIVCRMIDASRLDFIVLRDNCVVNNSSFLLLQVLVMLNKYDKTSNNLNIVKLIIRKFLSIGVDINKPVRAKHLCTSNSGLCSPLSRFIDFAKHTQKSPGVFTVTTEGLDHKVEFLIKQGADVDKEYEMVEQGKVRSTVSDRLLFPDVIKRVEDKINQERALVAFVHEYAGVRDQITGDFKHEAEMNLAAFVLKYAFGWNTKTCAVRQGDK